MEETLLRPGDLVGGRYEILCDVASGGMASVYAARVVGAQGFEKLVAIKRMLPKVSGDPRYRTMFLDEARVAAHIHSPFVVGTYDLGEEPDGSLYIVMDLVVGTSLATLLRGSVGGGWTLPIPVVASIGEQCARGLHDAHEATNHLANRSISCIATSAPRTSWLEWTARHASRTSASPTP